eukprot:jgi/Bigna1/134781/aug1.26_g9489
MEFECDNLLNLCRRAENIDLFSTPTNKTTSPLGGFVSIGVLFGMMAVVTVGIMALLGRELWNDSSLITVKFSQRVIYEADSNPDKPREKIKIKSFPCSIQNGYSKAVQGWCPEHRGEVLGEYSSYEYRYLNVVLEAAAGANITHLREVLKDVSVNLWIYEKKSRNYAIWRSNVYMTYEPQTWIGAEVYMHKVLSTKYDWLGLADTQEYKKMKDYEVRRKADQIDTDGEIFKVILLWIYEEVIAKAKLCSSLSSISALMLKRRMKRCMVNSRRYNRIVCDSVNNNFSLSLIFVTLYKSEREYTRLKYNSRLATKRKNDRRGTAALILSSPEATEIFKMIKDKIFEDFKKRDDIKTTKGKGRSNSDSKYRQFKNMRKAALKRFESQKGIKARDYEKQDIFALGGKDGRNSEETKTSSSKPHVELSSPVLKEDLDQATPSSIHHHEPLHEGRSSSPSSLSHNDPSYSNFRISL